MLLHAFPEQSRRTLDLGFPGVDEAPESQNFKIVLQNSSTSGNYQDFPEIPGKFRKIFDEKNAISVDFQEIWKKSAKISDFGENAKINSIF